MAEYLISINLPAEWQKEMDEYEDESGTIINHLEAHIYNNALGKDEGLIDVYAGDMPDDSTAEDQALSNYADIVGFDEDDPEDFNPIETIKFNGKNAYVFYALCEDDSPMMFISQEVKKGALAIICLAAKDDDTLEDLAKLVEKSLRISTKE